MRVRHEGDMPDREGQIRQVGRLLESGAFEASAQLVIGIRPGLRTRGRAVIAGSAALLEASVDMAAGPPAGMDGGDIMVAHWEGEANENRPLEIEGPVGSSCCSPARVQSGSACREHQARQLGAEPLCRRPSRRLRNVR
jgi:hypothetical protein